MSRKAGLTLTEVARLVGTTQHRLIYLCEKGVVRADIAEAKGRGSSRRFSARNLLEFAVALRLREAMLPVAAVAAVVQVLRAFERNVARELPGFNLPRSLQTANGPDLRLVLSGGEQLIFTLGLPGKNPRMFGGVDIRKLRLEKGAVRGVPRELKERTGKRNLGSSFGGPEGSKHLRLEMSVTQIAKDLPAKA